jgi:hypothetical protein
VEGRLAALEHEREARRPGVVDEPRDKGWAGLGWLPTGRCQVVQGERRDGQRQGPRCGRPVVGSHRDRRKCRRDRLDLIVAVGGQRPSEPGPVERDVGRPGPESVVEGAAGAVEPALAGIRDKAFQREGPSNWVPWPSCIRRKQSKGYLGRRSRHAALRRRAQRGKTRNLRRPRAAGSIHSAGQLALGRTTGERGSPLARRIGEKLADFQIKNGYIFAECHIIAIFGSKRNHSAFHT